MHKLGDFPFKRPQDYRFEKPSLFVRGTKSNYIADDAIPAIGEFFPCFRLVDVDAGHWLISENPEAFRQGEFFLIRSSYGMRHVILTCQQP